MKMRLLVFGALLMLTLVSAAFAADINGKWKATFQGGDMAIEQNFTFKVDVKQSLWGAASAGGLELAISLPISGLNAVAPFGIGQAHFPSIRPYSRRRRIDSVRPAKRAFPGGKGGGATNGHRH